jgi:hypothetical protein
LVLCWHHDASTIHPLQLLAVRFCCPLRRCIAG